MNTEIISSSSNHSLIPLPELPINVRLGTMEDIAFIDELQKKNNKNLGFLQRAALEGKIKLGEVLIAEEVNSGQCPVASEEEKSTGGVPTVAPNLSGLATNHWPLATRLGYLIGNDRYFKRDELGAIFQLCVVPNKQRGLIGATLLKALFERASYGCKLYCCWCAKDLEANRFWEAMGFVPIAFRSGSRNKLKNAEGKRVPRVHIFWQKRIRAGDESTPWWYPSQTGGGAIGEDRIVLPIPPGVHWSEVESVVLPGSEVANNELRVVSEDGTGGVPTVAPKSESGLATDDSPLTTKKSKRTKQPAIVPVKSSTIRLNHALSFAAPEPVEVKAIKPKREKPVKVKPKNDPKLVAGARELRDRYLEEINRNPTLVSNGKYEVARLVEPVPSGEMKQLAA